MGLGTCGDTEPDCGSSGRIGELAGGTNSGTSDACTVNRFVDSGLGVNRPRDASAARVRLDLVGRRSTHARADDVGSCGRRLWGPAAAGWFDVTSPLPFLATAAASLLVVLLTGQLWPSELTVVCDENVPIEQRNEHCADLQRGDK